MDLKNQIFSTSYVVVLQFYEQVVHGRMSVGRVENFVTEKQQYSDHHGYHGGLTTAWST